MARIYSSMEELIGRTPLLELRNITAQLGLKARLLAKLECFNPGGSSKDRVAAAMLNDAEKRGLLTADSVIIEPTSGNTGIGLAAVGAARGYRVIIVMPDTMSVERQLMMTAYGAELVLTDGKLGMQGAIDKAETLAREIPGGFLTGQFANPANPKAHYDTTGPEIWTDTDGEVDLFVAGVGTGGTLTGVAEYLKEKNPTVQVHAVEPSGSAILSGGEPGKHGLQGIGAGFIPKILNTEIYDKVIAVSEEQAYTAARMMGQREGILVGISSGAALHAAIEAAKATENEGKTIVVLLPDTGTRYLSTPLYS